MVIAIVVLLIIVLIILGIRPYMLNAEFSSKPAGSYEEASPAQEETPADDTPKDETT